MRLIDADELVKKWEEMLPIMVPDEDGKHPVSLEKAIEKLKDAPTVDAEPVRHGAWIEKEKDGFLHCSNCGYVRIGIPIMFNFEYCPKCGAKMDGE